MDAPSFRFPASGRFTLLSDSFVFLLFLVSDTLCLASDTMPSWRWTLEAQLSFHFTADLFGFFPMLTWPYGLVGEQANSVPDHMKMLSAVLDMFDYHPLVMEHLVAVLFFTPLDNP